MAVEEVIDPTGRRGAATRRNARRLLLPLLGVTLVLGSMFVIGFHSYQVAHRNTLRLSNELLAATQNYITQEVSGYLQPAIQGAQIGRDMLQHGALVAHDNRFQPYAASVLRQVPQIDAFYLANSGGDFELVQRSGEGGTETVVVTAQSGMRLRSESRSNASGQIVSREADRPATYDPRQSNYFTEPVRTRTTFWSKPYLFTPTKQPIITASIAYHAGDSNDHVFAVNIALDRLSAFLGSLRIGKNGQAVIADRDGTLIAAPGIAALHNDPGKVTLEGPDPSGHQAALLRAFDIFRVRGFGPQTFAMGAKNYVSIAAKLPAGAPDWVLLIVVPAHDFAAFSEADSRSTLLYSLSTVALALVLAGLLIRQGRRSDRLVDELALHNERAADEQASLHGLFAATDLLDADIEAPGLTERLAAATQADRVSVWRLVHDGTKLRCEDIYDRRRDGHMGGMDMPQQEIPAFIDALEAADAFEVPDAAADPRTERMFRLQMRSAGTRALRVVPIRSEQRILGALLLEDATRVTESQHFIDMIAGIVTLRLRGAAGESGMPAPQSATTDAPAEPDVPRGSYLMPPQTADGTPSPDGMFPAVAVMVVGFGESVATTPHGVEHTVAFVSEIAEAFQQIGRQHKLFAVKLAGHRLMAVAGCTRTPDPGAPQRLADAALALRELFLSRLAAADIDPVFQIGLDVGPVFGATLGKDPGVFNLWGDAVHRAEAMAASNAAFGSIQVTEAVYARLRDSFLFRNRGAFYSVRAGLGRVYILVGKQ